MYLPEATPAAVVAELARTSPADGECVLLLVAEGGDPDLNALQRALSSAGVPFAGGLFPGVLCGDQRHDRGAVLMRLPGLGPPILVRDLDRDPVDLPGIPTPATGRPTAIVLVDGLTSNISGFLSALFHRCASSLHYFGGGAGSLSLKQTPCLFTAEGVFQDAAIVLVVRLESRLGVRHGWQRITGPLVATKTERNVITELNWRPAFDVYCEVVESDAGRELTVENFFDVARGYPFGIHREGMEDVVRDPIAVTDEGGLVCVGEVPENTVLNVLKGEAESLIAAAALAARESRPEASRVARHGLVADCISRALYLQGDFEHELRAVRDAIVATGAPDPEGVLTLGEISSYGDGFIEFFNKTIVSGVLHE